MPKININLDLFDNENLSDSSSNEFLSIIQTKK